MAPPQFVLVGSGIASLTAAETIRQRAPTAAITMISEEAHDFYSRPGLAYLLRGDIPEKQLVVRNAEDVQSLQVTRVTARVERLLCANHELVLSTGQRVRYDRLLLATGSLAVPPAFPGGNLAGVVKLDSLDDARNILKRARRSHTAVVVGGGITALELAEGLNARRMRVHYCMRGTRYWSDVLDEIESDIVLQRLQHDGISVHPNTQVKQLIGTAGQVSAVETQAGEVIPCQLVAVAIGVRPRLELARQAGLQVGKGILVNDYLQTSAHDIYAAGDVAEVHDPHSGCTTLDVLWSTALSQGRAAGMNMTGGNRPYAKGIALNVTQLAGLKVAIIGAVGKGGQEDLVTIARGDSEAWRLARQALVVTERHEVNRVRIMVAGQRIVGALLMGDQTWSQPLQRLIAARTDVSPLGQALTGGGTQALEALAEFYQQWERTQLQGASRV
jgi:NAD(P)H-nitrite reductase large subunit